MDWLLERQPRLEKQLAARHLAAGALVLCDVTSTYFCWPQNGRANVRTSCRPQHANLTRLWQPPNGPSDACRAKTRLGYAWAGCSNAARSPNISS
jgi:hypothetical protein